MKPKISDMAPELQVKYAAFAAKMTEAGIPFALSCVLRTKEEQEALYVQGRRPLPEVNALRQRADMPLLKDASENIRVTWTKNSRHFPGQDGKSCAFDIVILTAGRKSAWDTRWDGNKNDVPDYIEAAAIGQSVGLEAGGMWGKPDYPHYQLAERKNV